MKQEKWITGIICILVVFCAGCFYLYHGQDTARQEVSFQSKMQTAAPEEPTDSSGGKPDQSELSTECAVYIYGAVKHPGVYRFAGTARVCDVVEAAGGFTQNAAEASVNQARYITDGEQIEIVSRKRWKKKRKQSQDVSSAGHQTTAQDDGKININTATETELMTLSGIGQSKAKAIVDHRMQNGMFASVQDIMQVPGIKEGVYNQIKDSITV